MDLIIVGYVLQALACVKAEGKVTDACVELKRRATPISLYVCQRSMAVAIERAPAVSTVALGLEERSYHITFSCEPVHGERHASLGAPVRIRT